MLSVVVVGCFFFASSAIAFDEAGPDPAIDARSELFAGRYERASSLYSKILAEKPNDGDAWYGLVRAELEMHHSRQVYAAAEQAIAKAPGSAGAETVAGLAMYRRGDLGKAEEHFRTALKIDPNYPGALRGLASIYSAVSKPKTARDLRLKAFQQSPDDPELMLTYANTLKGTEHIAALQAALSKVDSGTELARNLRIHIANDQALGDRKLRRLVSPYQSSRVKLLQILSSPGRPRGLALRLTLNQKETVTLLLNTDGSGIAVSQKVAEKAGLKVISTEASEAKGIGDQKPSAALRYLASEVRAGDIIFADYPISVFRSAQTADFDGIIGADVFGRFLVKIDFPRMELSLEPRAASDMEKEDDTSPVDADDPTPGFSRVFRFGDHLAIPTRISGGNSEVHTALFLLDSGGSLNLIDTETAKAVTGISDDPRTIIRGLQGNVNKTSQATRVSLTFAGFRQENPNLVAISLEKMGDSMGVGFGGILGMPVLGNLAVTVDYRNGTIKLDYKKP